MESLKQSGQQQGGDDKSGASNTTSYPYRNNNNKSKNNGNSSKKNGSNTENTKKFTGHNQDELKGCILTETSSTQDYTNFKERIETLAGTKYSPTVGRSIKNLERMSYMNFAPKPVTAADYSMPDPDDATKIIEIPGQKATVEAIYTAQISEVAKEMLRYARDMEKMYVHVFGQLDNALKEKLKSSDSWPAIEQSNCIVQLMSLIRDICYQGNRTKVHPPTNLIRAYRKLLCTRQKTNDCADYVKSTLETFDVLTSLGGSILCPAIIKYHLQGDPELPSFKEYTDLPAEKRAIINSSVEQEFIASLLVEGCDGNTSNLKDELGNSYCLGTTKYPKTTNRALDMLNHFKNTKKAPKAANNTNSNRNKSDKRTHKDKDSEDSTTLVTKGTKGSIHCTMSSTMTLSILSLTSLIPPYNKEMN